MKHIFVLVIAMLLCAGCVPVSAANVTYPQEYYDLKVRADNHTNAGMTWDSQNTAHLWSVFYELRRQTILMEKQNELIAEQNEMLKKLVPKDETKLTLTCYDSVTMEPISCTNPGYSKTRVYCNGNCSEVSP